jgi:hypothetical protein
MRRAQARAYHAYLQVKLKFGRVVDLLVAELDHEVAATLDGLAADDRVEHGVDGDLNVLDHARQAGLDAGGEDGHQRLLAEAHHLSSSGQLRGREREEDIIFA